MGCPLPALLLAPFCSRGFDYRSSFFAPKPHENACYAGYGGPREQCRSVPRGGVKKKKERERSVVDRQSGVARCHGVALKKTKKKKRERLVPNRESSIALCHGVALKKKGSVEDRESGVALCHRVALKKEREIGRGPREQYHPVPRGGVKKKRIGR